MLICGLRIATSNMSDKEEVAAAVAAVAEEQAAEKPVEKPADAAVAGEQAEAKAEDAVEEVTQSLEEILALGQGLDDQDYKAELEVLQNDPNSNLFSAVTFEELNLCVAACVCRRGAKKEEEEEELTRRYRMVGVLCPDPSRCSRACTP